MEQSDLQRFVDQATSLYTPFDIPKKNGGFRTIRPPCRSLRAVQKALYRQLEGRTRYPRWVHGCVPRRSIFTHASPHVGRFMVATLDVEKFFPSVRSDFVRRVFSRFNFRDEALVAAVRLTTLDDQLPQGAPSSGFLANLVFDGIDRRIDAICRKHQLRYTRYVDDLAISGDEHLGHLKAAILRCVEGTGLVISADKGAFMSRSQRQVITNLLVNDRLCPTKEFIQAVNEEIRIGLSPGGAHALALADGVSISRVKNRINGRVRFIEQAAPALGASMRRKLYGIDWKRRWAEVLDEPCAPGVENRVLIV